MPKNGDKVKISYVGTLDDGTVFDSCANHEPIEFTVGSGSVIPGFEKAVLDMKKGEEKNIKIPSKEAYGDVNPELLKKIPRDKLPKEIKAGMVIGVQLPNGAQMPVKVIELSANEATIDFNHPLAGKNLNFKLKLL